MSTLALAAWRQKAPTKKAALRQLLSDGQFHSQQEMVRATGSHRFGSVLFDIHNEVDMGQGLTPVHYELEASGTRVRYRATDQAHCAVCTKENRQKPSEVIKRLTARVAELEAENAKLRGGR